jgi:hypothetical protein
MCYSKEQVDTLHSVAARCQGLGYPWEGFEQQWAIDRERNSILLNVKTDWEGGEISRVLLFFWKDVILSVSPPNDSVRHYSWSCREGSIKDTESFLSKKIYSAIVTLYYSELERELGNHRHISVLGPAARAKMQEKLRNRVPSEAELLKQKEREDIYRRSRGLVLGSGSRNPFKGVTFNDFKDVLKQINKRLLLAHPYKICFMVVAGVLCALYLFFKQV